MSRSNFQIPAFPYKFEVEAGTVHPFTGTPVACKTIEIFNGMSLRDYFAAKAMAQLIAIYEPGCEDGTIPSCAEAAYQYADAMLKARNEGGAA